MKLNFSRPGKPTDNAFIESFNARFRMECLNEHWFLTLDDARGKIESWRRDYNECGRIAALATCPRPSSPGGVFLRLSLRSSLRNTPGQHEIVSVKFARIMD